MGKPTHITSLSKIEMHQSQELQRPRRPAPPPLPGGALGASDETEMNSVGLDAQVGFRPPQHYGRCVAAIASTPAHLFG
jgi:hypothetical protein